jgi:hypothetical protein
VHGYIFSAFTDLLIPISCTFPPINRYVDRVGSGLKLTPTDDVKFAKMEQFISVALSYFRPPLLRVDSMQSSKNVFLLLTELLTQAYYQIILRELYGNGPCDDDMVRVRRNRRFSTTTRANVHHRAVFWSWNLLLTCSRHTSLTILSRAVIYVVNSLSQTWLICQNSFGSM